MGVAVALRGVKATLGVYLQNAILGTETVN